MQSAWWMYMVECRDGSLYTGIAKDPARRFGEHCAGRGAKFTRIKGAVALLAAQRFDSRRTAAQAEYRLKRKPLRIKMQWVALHPWLTAGASREHQAPTPVLGET